MVCQLRSEIVPLTASCPQRSDAESVNQKRREMETLATLQYKDFFTASKLASIPFFVLFSVILYFME